MLCPEEAIVLLEGPLFLASPIFWPQLSGSCSFQLSSTTAHALLRSQLLPGSLMFFVHRWLTQWVSYSPSTTLCSSSFMFCLASRAAPLPWACSRTRLSQPQRQLVLDPSTSLQTKVSLLSASTTLAVLPLLTNGRKLEMML